MGKIKINQVSSTYSVVHTDLVSGVQNLKIIVDSFNKQSGQISYVTIYNINDESKKVTYMVDHQKSKLVTDIINSAVMMYNEIY